MKARKREAQALCSYQDWVSLANTEATFLQLLPTSRGVRQVLALKQGYGALPTMIWRSSSLLRLLHLVLCEKPDATRGAFVQSADGVLRPRAPSASSSLLLQVWPSEAQHLTSMHRECEQTHTHTHKPPSYRTCICNMPSL